MRKRKPKIKKKTVIALTALAVSVAVLLSLFADFDGDGLSNLTELRLGTNMLRSDTDGDGLNDGLEVNGWTIVVNNQPKHVTSNPLAVDSDEDNLTDREEFYVYHTCPSNPDTDNDGLSDYFETIPWLISVNSQARYVTSIPYLRDSDGDTSEDRDEYNFFTDPKSADTDLDGIPDNSEIARGSDPTISEGMNVGMLIFVSPQYAGDRRVNEKIMEYIIAVNADIGWITKIVGLSSASNRVGRIRETIRNFYSSDGTSVALLVGDDIAVPRLSFPNYRFSIYAESFYVELNEMIPYKLDVEMQDGRKISKSYTFPPDITADGLDSLLEELGTFREGELSRWESEDIRSRPEVCVSFLRPPIGYYDTKVNHVLSLFSKFTHRNENYGDNILILYDPELPEPGSSGFRYGWETLGGVECKTAAELAIQNPYDSPDLSFLYGKRFKLLGATGHGSATRAYMLSTSDMQRISTPFLMVGGCGVGAFSAEWGEQVFAHQDVRVVVAGLPFSWEHFAWYAGTHLAKGKTIAEAWLSYSTSIWHSHQRIFGDPTFRY